MEEEVLREILLFMNPSIPSKELDRCLNALMNKKCMWIIFTFQ